MSLQPKIFSSKAVAVPLPGGDAAVAGVPHERVGERRRRAQCDRRIFPVGGEIRGRASSTRAGTPVWWLPR